MFIRRRPRFDSGMARSCTISCAIPIRSVLMASRPVVRVPLPVTPQPAAELPYSEFTQRIENASASRPRAGSEHATTDAVGPAASPQPSADLRSPRADPAASSRHAPFIPDTHGSMLSMARAAAVDALADDLRPLGQIHNSFIIAAGKDGLWIIDQHVAHERILFEKVLQAARKRAAWSSSSC